MTKAEELLAALNGDGCLGRSRDDEPVFILCARDPVAAAVIRYWADLREMKAARSATLDAHEKEKIQTARVMSLRFDDWQHEESRVRK